VEGDGESRVTRPVTAQHLEEWEEHGAVWRVVEVSDERAVIDLCSCTGEPMDRVLSDEPELIAYVRARGGR
jgi:hypothetical protein